MCRLENIPERVEAPQRMNMWTHVVPAPVTHGNTTAGEKTRIATRFTASLGYWSGRGYALCQERRRSPLVAVS